MQTKYILIVAAVVAAIILMSWLRTRSTSSPVAETPQEVSLGQLSDGEQKISDSFERFTAMPF
jgi:HAMP domain-containing protein